MKSQWFRYAIIAAFACVLGALAHASISGAMQSQNTNQPQNTSEDEPALDQNFPGLEARLTSQKAGDQPSRNKELKYTLLQRLWDVIDAADDLSSEEKSEARDILEKADPILVRIKKENKRAIEILRNPPRRVLPQKPAPDNEKQGVQEPAENREPKQPAESSARESGAE